VELNELQTDALVELIGLGFGRAAASLSKLTGYRVVLDRPSIDICPAPTMADALHGLGGEDVATVHQIFSGPVAGDAILVLDQPGAMALKRLLTDEPPLPLGVDNSAREVLTEVGNLLLNACLGTLGNILQVQVTFSVPKLSLATLTTLLDSLLVREEGVRYALIVQSGFRLRDSAIKGYMVIVLSVASLERLLRAISRWDDSPPGGASGG
jgi:chemotaxis protein CheC